MNAVTKRLASRREFWVGVAAVALVVLLVGALLARPSERLTPMPPGAVTPPAAVTLPVSTRPFGACFTGDGSYLFVGTSKKLTVLRADWTQPVPAFSLVKNVTVGDLGFYGLALSNSGKVLAAANKTGVSIFDVDRLVTPGKSALLARADTPAEGALEVLFSPDDKYLFTCLEYGRSVLVLDAATLQTVRMLPAHKLPVGLTMLQHPVKGTMLLFVAQFKRGQPNCPTTQCSGTLTAVSLSTWETVEVAAGCCPVRVEVGGDKIFITARGEDKVRVMDLDFNPVGEAPTGPAPVGMKLAAGGRVLVVVASNRFSKPPANGKVHFYSADTLQELATVSAGKFPRGVGVAPNGWVAVTNFSSASVDLHNAAALLPTGLPTGLPTTPPPGLATTTPPPVRRR